MKKLLSSMLLLSLLVSVFIIVGCTNQKETTGDDASVSVTRTLTRTFEAETGPLEIPYEPKRIVVLDTSLSGHFLKLEASIIGIDTWSKLNPTFEDYLKDVVELSQDDVEKIISLNPDLIIAPISNKNLSVFEEIAPTVTLTFGKLDYLERFLEVGKLLNKENAAQSWIESFRSRAAKLGDEVRAKHGNDLTITVIESFDKQMFIFGDNFARGTEILYREMKLQMPEKVKEATLEAGMHMLSAEVLPEFVGDFLVIVQGDASDISFKEAAIFKNIPAVKNNRVIEVASNWFAFNDPITLDLQLAFFRKIFLGE